jgi:hypothetical protein
METRNKGNAILRSVFTGIGFTIFFLLIGIVLDYLITQGVSQFILTDCSEDCYFRLFNSIFIVVVIISVAGGILSGIRSYRRLSE